MRRKIPSTGALCAFESAARHQSFTKAADELAVTQSAICRQIGTLEDFLGVKLFRRSRRGVALTEAGVAYSRKVVARLDDFERDTIELMARGGQGATLELAVVPTFATKWLLPRLPKFLAAHPDITVNLTSQTRPFLFDGTEFDAAIHAGPGMWPGTEGLRLMGETLVAVCSPALIAPRGALRRGDWKRYPLLQQSTRPYAWREWFASQDMDVEGDMAGPKLELFSMVAEAAKQGMGIALMPRLLVEDELERGSLVQASLHEHPSSRSYYLIFPEEKAENTALGRFRDWLAAQAGSRAAGGAVTSA
ncbi:LysR family transcriptional regulator [Trinickia sp.]|uniref:LysR family transcriptional regulator n=1 Tax=Trinickia sp. TaxID=2571163 RepID=UPI003F80040F